MIWLAMIGLTAICLLPLAIGLRQGRMGLRSRRDAALALYRAQRLELDRERAARRLPAGEYDAALLEVQRRLLAEDAQSPASYLVAGDRGLIWLAIILVPLLAFGLYLIQGAPWLPDRPFSPPYWPTIQH